MTTETARAFYRRQGWNPGYGHKLKTQGRLVALVVDGKQMIDVEASVARLAATADPNKSHMAAVNDRQRAAHRGEPAQAELPITGPESKNATFMQAKTAHAVFDAKTAKLDFEERSGKLVRVDAVKQALASAFTSTRDSLLQIPSRLAAVLAAETDAAKVHELLQLEIYRALEGISTLQTSAKLAGREQLT
jgi:hypothetical protein